MIEYVKNYISIENAFESLRDSIDWIDIENKPRKECWDNTDMTPYTYGNGVQQSTYEPQKIGNEIVNLVREKIYEDYSVYYQGCFLNYYETGRDGIGWHSDDDPSIDHDKSILIVTFGNSRDINWKPIGSKGLDVIKTLTLENGSLAIMPSGMQNTHLHRIPKVLDNRTVGPRISLTFRRLK